MNNEQNKTFRYHNHKLNTEKNSGISLGKSCGWKPDFLNVLAAENEASKYFGGGKLAWR